MNDDRTHIRPAPAANEASRPPDPPRRAKAAKKKKRSKSSRKAAAKTATAAIEARIGHKFVDAALLTTAITHVSALKPTHKRGDSYQRLEFLGDHVLGLVVSDMLYRAFPEADEGELSRRLADLVRREACAEVARTIDLGAAIKLGPSEANAGGRRRLAILGDVCEALIGAVFIDGGYAAAAAMI